MSVAFFFEMPQVDAGTAAQFSAYINERLGPRQAEGGVFHAEGPDGRGGWWSFNVWASDGAFRRFFEAYVVPAAAHIGVDTPAYRRLEVAWDTSQVPASPSD